MRRCFGFSIERYNFSNIQKCKYFNFSLSTVPAEIAISPEVFNAYFKPFFWLNEVEPGYCGWKFKVRRYFGIATLQLFQYPENVNILILPFTLSQQKCYISRSIYEFSKTFFWLKEEEGGYCGWKFKVRRYFGFPIATLQLFQNPENVNISILPFTLSQQKCYISRSITRIF